MLINVRVNDENQALEFINNVLQEMGHEETDSIHYADDKISIEPEMKAEHTSEGPHDVTIENFLMLSITVGDLDYKTQEIIKKYKNRLHRL